jgi:hypothetical protein
VFKPSRRALGIASIFTVSAVCFAPAASAGLLGGSSGNGGLNLPVLSGGSGGGDLLGGLLGGNLLGGNLLGGDLVGTVAGLPGALLGGDLPIGGVLGGDSPLGGVLGGDSPLGGLSASDADSSGGEMLSPLTDTTLACDAAIPQVLRSLVLGDLTDTICTPFDGGFGGLTGLLGSL